MAINRVWEVKYIAGNPAIFSKVFTAANGPFRRSEALSSAIKVAENGGGWRVWVEHTLTSDRVYESASEFEHKASTAATSQKESNK